MEWASWGPKENSLTVSWTEKLERFCWLFCSQVAPNTRNVKQKVTSAYHPRTEFTWRINRTLKTTISSYVVENHKDLDKHLPDFRFALKPALHESTRETSAEYLWVTHCNLETHLQTLPKEALQIYLLYASVRVMIVCVPKQ